MRWKGHNRGFSHPFGQWAFIEHLLCAGHHVRSGCTPGTKWAGLFLIKRRQALNKSTNVGPYEPYCPRWWQHSEAKNGKLMGHLI